ncbi:MAG: hypothetical protein J6V50_03390 [Clostridia bacterium]|nr:hypothetical protein [Clostridia bacterium]
MENQENRWLKNRIREVGMKQNEFMKTIGIHEQHLKWLENKPKQSPQTLLKIAKLLQYNPQKFLDFWDNKINEQQLLSDNDKTSVLISIDMLDVVACCGNGIEAYTENVVGQWSMPIADFKQITSTTPDNIKLIAVKGDSMQPTIKEGDFCFVDISKRQPDSDGMFLLRIATGLAVKRIQGGLTNNLIIKSDNPKYDNLTAAVGEVSVLGKVIYILKAEKVG